LGSKTSRLEVYEIASNGLVAKLQIPLNGRITALKTISSSDGDMLFICTEKEQFCLLKYDSSTSSVFTLTHGDLHDRACRPIEQGIIVASSPNVPYIVIHHVQGLVKVIPIDTRRGSLREPVNRRIEELQVLDIKLLDNGELAVLHETAGGGYRVKTYRVGKELENGWNIDDLDEGSHILIPIPSPRGGIIVISGVSIFYYNHANNAQCAVSLVPTRITCYCQIDENGYRFLLANSEGELFVLILFGEGDRVDSLKMEFLGTTVIPSTLTYLDNGFVYIGSHLGDSQIIHLSSPRLADGNFVKIMNVIQSTAPMVDFATVDLEMIGQSSVVACCGAYKEGSLRIIRKGANLTASAAVDIQMSILYMFTVARNEENIVFLSTLNETKILRCDDGGIEELTAYEQLYTNESSLLITECEGIVIQVTPSTVSFGGKLWKPKNGASIVTVGCYENMIALCTMDRQLYTLDCQRPPKSAGIALPGETSAVCIAFIEGCWFTIMAFWNSSKLHVINDEGVTVGSIAVKTRELIRSLQFSIFEEIPTLFVGLGDGSVLHFTVLLDGLELIAGPMHRAVLGSGPVRIVKTKIGMTETLFAFSDRPFIIDSFRERITFSLTNAKNVSAVTGVGDELLLARDGSLVFCTVDREGQLHHQVHSLGETATRILHVPNAKAYALLTSPLHSTESIIEDREKDVGRSHVELLDQDVLTSMKDDFLS
jgi:DNA damage-binding protein 1